MNVELIGSWAGKVWTALDAVESMDLKQLRKVTKLKEKEVYAEIGWLGREAKLNITENEGELVASLVK